jgi:hypothetical protein
MSWSVPVLLRIVAAYVVGPLLSKPLVDTHPQRTVVLLQFAGCLAVALPLALARHQLQVDWRMVAVGFGNGLAAYCYYKAIAMSLSRTALFAFWDDLLAMGLSYGILHEGQFLNARLLLGIGLSVGAVIGFTVHSTHAQPPSEPSAARPPRRLYLYAGAYSLLVGGGVFFMRYLGVQGTGLGTFLVNWYGGVVAAALLLVLTSPDARAALTTFSRGHLVRLGGLSLVTLIALSAAFLAYRLAPQTVVQPLFLVGEMVAPALLGLYVFAEREAFDRWEYLYFGLGLAGGLVVALSVV